MPHRYKVMRRVWLMVGAVWLVIGLALAVSLSATGLTDDTTVPAIVFVVLGIVLYLAYVLLFSERGLISFGAAYVVIFFSTTALSRLVLTQEVKNVITALWVIQWILLFGAVVIVLIKRRAANKGVE